MTVVDVLNLRRKTVIRTFRIDEVTDQVLGEEAERQGITVNSLVNQVFKKFAVYDRFTMRHRFISFTPQIFELILNNCDDARLAASGEAAGVEFTKEVLKALGLPQNRESVVRVIRDIASRAANWYDCEFHPFNGHEGVFATHTHGVKWSIFLAGFFKSFMKSVLSAQIEPEVTSHSIFFRLPKQSNSLLVEQKENQNSLSR